MYVNLDALVYVSQIDPFDRMILKTTMIYSFYKPHHLGCVFNTILVRRDLCRNFQITAWYSSLFQNRWEISVLHTYTEHYISSRFHVSFADWSIPEFRCQLHAWKCLGDNSRSNRHSSVQLPRKTCYPFIYIKDVHGPVFVYPYLKFPKNDSFKNVESSK